MMDINVLHDEYTRESLDEAFVHKVKNEELKLLKSEGVWRIVPRAHAELVSRRYPAGQLQQGRC